jgi:lipopolysaccharide assembly outer membrane protein LptD (OstA)
MLLAAIVVLGCAVTADAQRRPFPDSIREVTATRMKTIGSGVTWFKGSVTIVIAGAVVSADEATITLATNEIELRGNVHMTLTPAPTSLGK